MSCHVERVVERVRYFDGELLTAADLQAEQEFVLDRQRSHNRLHGTGVVWGMEVGATEPPSSSVVVQPGVAIDPCGREIVLTTEPVQMAVPATGGAAAVVIEYAEALVADLPTPEGAAPSRIREVPRLSVIAPGAVPPAAAVLLARVDGRAGAPIAPGDISDERVRLERPPVHTDADVRLARLGRRLDVLTASVVGIGVVAGYALLRGPRGR